LEFDLLCTLASQPARVFEREQLLREVWGYEYVENARVVDAVVKRLRAKLRAVAPDLEPIETVRGIGYKLVVC
jgi:DNA-binding response OmpR family regulator